MFLYVLISVIVIKIVRSLIFVWFTDSRFYSLFVYFKKGRFFPCVFLYLLRVFFSLDFFLMSTKLD